MESGNINFKIELPQNDISANELHKLIEVWNNKTEVDLSAPKNIVSELEGEILEYEKNNKGNKKKKNKNYEEDIDYEAKKNKLKINKNLIKLGNQKKVKVNKYPTPIKGLYLCDIKLNASYKEDEIYLNSDFVKTIIRRGLSTFYNEDTITYDFARVGLPKFFDYKKRFDGKDPKEILLKNTVLGKLLQVESSDKNAEFLVYLTDKVNGENFQVSFNSKYKTWVIGSKNVTICVRDEGDMEFYKDWKNFEENFRGEGEKEESEGEENYINEIKTSKTKDNKSILERFKYALEFAESWFQILNKRFNNEKIAAFTKELADFTLVGESVGVKGHEHIKIYEERDVIFYGLVNNKKMISQYCVPLNESYDLFKKYNLSFTDNSPSSTFKTITELLEYTNLQYDIIFDKSIKESGEGSVAYFCVRRKIGSGFVEEIKGIGKIKTFEYRFLRKIREKCKKIKMEEVNDISQKPSNKNNKKNQNISQNNNIIYSTNPKNKQNTLTNTGKSINKLKEEITNESKLLIKDVEKSLLNLHPETFDDWIRFSENVFEYYEKDYNSDYINCYYASFIEEMKKKFKEDKKEINENLIEEIHKKIFNDSNSS